MTDQQHQISVREMRPEESRAVTAQARRTFMLAVAPHYGPEGVREFLAYADPVALLERMNKGHMVLVAQMDGQLAGMIEVRDLCHVAMLFVAPGQQRQGVGRLLLERAVAICRERNPGLSRVTVFASPNAIKAYEHFGFIPSGNPRFRKGVAYLPMTLNITAAHD